MKILCARGFEENAGFAIYLWLNQLELMQLYIYEFYFFRSFELIRTDAHRLKMLADKK